MKNLFLSIGILITGSTISQVNVYECGSINPNVTSAEVLNGAFGFYRPCIEFDANNTFLFSGDVNKDIKASEYIHIKEGFHAGLFNANKGVHLRITEKSLYDVAVLNYPDLNAIEKLKKVEFGVDLEGEIEDRIKAFIANTGTQTLYHLNPFIEDDMNALTSEISMHATFIHPQTWTIKERDFFYYHEYEQIGQGYGVDHVNNYGEYIGDSGWSDVLNDNNSYLMRVRFAPPRAGEWEAHFSITYDGNTIELPVFTFLVQDNNHPGFVKVHFNQRNLRRDDGIVFPVGHVLPGPYNRANGQQVAWGDTGGQENKTEYNTTVADWNQYLGDVESYINQGGKSLKIVQTSYGNLLEFEELGNYRKRLQYAWEQDKILEMCEDNDVLLNFNLLFQDVIFGYGQNGGPKTPAQGGGFWGDPWDYGNYNPDGSVNSNDYYPPYCYFVDSTLPSHQFLNPVLMNYHKQRTRYYVARYGYSPQIYTWELMSEPFHMDAFETLPESPANELNHPGHQVAMNAINTYHNELSAYIKNELEDIDHLITLDQAIAVPDDPSNAAIFPYQCASNPLIDIIGFNYYSDRPDKLIIGKEDKNGKENLIFSEGETSMYKIYRDILDTIGFKPIILSEMGEATDKIGLNCYENVANEINVMTYGFIGVAGMHPWEGYQYGYQNQYDERQLWPATISAEKHMNSDKVLRVLDDWNGWWNQGRQVAFIKEKPAVGPNEIERVKELQYYVSESTDFATGYVRNRSYNIYTASNWADPSNCDIPASLQYPFNVFYVYEFDDGPEKNHLYVKGLQNHTLYQTRWFDYITGAQLSPSNIQESDNKHRIKLQYPILSPAPSNPRPILWFTTEKVNLRPENEEQSEEKVIASREELFFDVYPNPFNDELIIHSERNDLITIYSVTGKLVRTMLMSESETKISTANLEKGVYFIHSSYSNETIKLVKQ